MFGRIFASDPTKTMSNLLQDACPDPAIWSQVADYLVYGRTPKSREARAALRAYIDLRDHLAGLAAFKAGGDLSHQALARPCRDFWAAYQPPEALEPRAAEAWARFLLAADHLLSQAYEAALCRRGQRAAQCRRMEEAFARARESFIAPLAREIAGQRRPAADAASAAAPETGGLCAALAA
jgi:hypothetical protein